VAKVMGSSIVKKNSAGSRLLNSVGGIFAGIAMSIICLIALTCNEASNVKAIRAFDEVEKNFIETGSAQVDAANNGKLVAIKGGLTFSPVSDSAYMVTANSFVLARKVEMFQWREQQKGGSTDKEVVYSYDGVWSSSPISSSGFQDKSKENKPWPSDASYQSKRVYTDDAALGDFRVSSEQLQDLSVNVDLPVPENAKLPAGFSRSADGKYIYNGDLSDPDIGDLRVSFNSSDITKASMLGQQLGDTIVSYKTKNETMINRMFAGERSGTEMLVMLRTERKFLTWFFRIMLTILVCLGFSMILMPVQVLVSFIPAIGKFLSNATKSIALLIGSIVGVSLSLLVIAISWIAVRPLVGIPLLIIAAGLIVLLTRFRKSKANAPANTSTAGTPQAAASWVCECGTTNTTKFCGHCGKPA